MSKEEQLEKLKNKMNKDTSLPLREEATNLVFSDGSANAEIMFIGEGPGYWEDQKAIPFVGNAGAFLNQLLTTAGLKREDVFITNVIHYRPPNNRDPEPSEIKAFQPYLDKMIDIIQPEIIVTLGRFSMAKFVPGVRISSVHGKPQVVSWDKREFVVIPMYHPAAGLRNPQIKMQSIDDFRKLPDLLEQAKSEKAKKKKKDETKQMNLI